MDVVADEDDAETARPRLRDVAQHHPGFLDTEGGRRLVQDQHLGTEADRPPGVAHPDPHLVQLVPADPVGGLDVEAAERSPAGRRLRAEEEVAGDAHQRDHRQILVDRRDAGGERLAWRAEVHLIPFDQVAAFAGRVDAGKDLDQRRLAGSVVAEQAHHLPGVDAHRDVFQCDDAAEVARDVLNLEERRPVGRRGLTHQRAPIARVRMYRLTRTAMTSIAPRTAFSQPGSTPMKTMPCRTMPKISAPKTGPIADP